MHDVQCAVGLALLNDAGDVDLAGTCKQQVSNSIQWVGEHIPCEIISMLMLF